MTLALIRITLQLLLYCILPSSLDAASSLRAPRLQWRHHVSSTDAPSQHIVHPAPSKFTFSWVNPLFNIGNRELEIRDLWSVINDTSAVTHYFQGNGSSTASHTNTSLVQAYRQSPLFANLLQRNRHPIRVASVWKLLHTSLLFLPSFLLRRILTHRLATDMALLFIVLCAKTIAENQYFMHMTNAVVETRNFVSNIIFRKALHLARSNTTASEVLQLMQLDGHRLEHVLLSLHIVWDGFLQIFGYSLMLYSLLGSPVIIGVLMMLATIPLNSMRFTEYILSLFSFGVIYFRMERQRADMIQHVARRLRDTAELFRNAFTVKSYNWIAPFLDRILSSRRKELLSLRKATYLRSAVIALTTVTPAFMAKLTYIVYAMLGKSLNSANAFAALNIFNQMRLPLMLYPMVMNSFIDGRLGLNRIESFLNLPEIPSRSTLTSTDHMVEINNATFAWSSNNVTLDNVTLSVQPGDLVAVKGPVGSGKSSLLHAIIGDIPVISGEVRVAGNVSYAAQQYWLPHDTIRNIVLFHTPYNATRYYEVLRICGLISDLQQMPLRDQTVITDNGANLSGGQKQRLCLARALYQNADIYLLDDTLSALDNRLRRHVTRGLRLWLKDKTKILVTSQNKSLPFASWTVHMNKTAEGIGYIQSVIPGNQSHYLIDTSTQVPIDIRRDGKRASSDVSLSDDQDVEIPARKHSSLVTPYLTYFKSMKSNRLVALVGIVYIATNIMQQLQQFTMTLWLKRSQHRVFIQMLCGASSLLALFTWLRAYLVTLLGARASDNLHKDLLYRSAHAPLSYYESSQASSLLNLFAKDFESIDQQLPFALGQATSTTLQVLSNLVSNIIISPMISFVLMPISTAYFMIAKSYHRVALKLKSLEPRTKTPLFRHIMSSLAGVSTIRSFGKLDVVLERGRELVADHVRVVYAQRSIERWLSMRMEMLGNAIVFVTSLFSLYAGDTLQGISLINAMGLTSNLYWLVRHWVDVEVLMNSVQKVGQALNLPQEQAYYRDRPANISNSVLSDVELLRSGWIKSGDISIDNIFLSYGNQTALRNVSLHIPANHSVGIVGRTGSGKSSILRALLRLTELEGGRIAIDGINICDIGLATLRSQIAIVPQHPTIFSGTVRRNLDPFGEYSDSDLWKALYKAHIGDAISSLPSGLDSVCDASTFSLGQQQLLCLSRAILRRSKVVLLDEATSAVDSHFDLLIQKTIRSEFGNGKCTLITVAHRLTSVMDADVIVVMDRGEVLEVDTPLNLLSNRSSYFSQLVAADS